MSLALSSRGYLCPAAGRAPTNIGPGPVITGILEQKPLLTGAGELLADAPSITGVGIQAPEIDLAGAGQQTPPADAPSIDGGGVMRPEIDSGEED